MPAASSPTRRSTSRAPARYSSQTASVPEQRRERAGDDPDLRRVGGEGVRDAGAAAVPDAEHEVHEVRVGGRVDVVVRVPVVAEQADRPGHEVRVLVGVVGVRQAVAVAPDAQQEGEQQRPRPQQASADRRGRPQGRRRPSSPRGSRPKRSAVDIGGVVLARGGAIEAGAAAGCRRSRRLSVTNACLKSAGRSCTRITTPRVGGGAGLRFERTLERASTPDFGRSRIQRTSGMSLWLGT